MCLCLNEPGWIKSQCCNLSYCAESYDFLGTRIPRDEADTSPIVQEMLQEHLCLIAVVDLCLCDWSFNMLEQRHVDSTRKEREMTFSIQKCCTEEPLKNSFIKVIITKM